eukprot:CAMPEP_0195523496 /NCGR_PEP_ID=MMETSP0794_2-20130614/22731_1 /TAXON_ID=515487 /ORGANISM="Stephanopyxis turris, Strain CCMP 815" /LENGTH=254 /DNA_ID=CAMNT_0040653511 /DNA_START=173 /DNA_END=937 /DNA_ORIENTATION=-
MSMNANALLAIGASPAMVHGKEEVEEFVCLASALYVNVGTLDGARREAMMLAVRKAKEAGVPWVLDPVAAGGTKHRLDACLQLLDEGKPTVVRGNPSEMLALTRRYNLSNSNDDSSRGPDSTAASNDALTAAKVLAQKMKCVVAVTGEVDYVTDGTRTFAVYGGDVICTLVTAAGCSLSAVVAAFVASSAGSKDCDYLGAAVAACAAFSAAAGLARERLGKGAGPGSFHVALIDALHTITEDDVQRLTRIEELV